MLKKLFLVCLLSLGFLSSKASHYIAGADISYVDSGNGIFKVILKLYRDCSGSTLGNSVDVRVEAYCPSYGSQMQTFWLDSAGEVSQTCNGIQTTCDIGSSPYTGIQEYVYSKIFYLPPTCTGITFSYDEDARIDMSGYDNLKNNPSNRAVYNKVIQHQQYNNGVYFSELPIIYGCNGEINNYNLSAIDPDGDSLRYEIVPTKANGGNDIQYESGYNTSQPFAFNPSPYQPTLLNAETGQLSFVPTQIQQVLITVKIYEYDTATGVLKGESLRDILIVTTPCNNDLVLSGVDYTNSYVRTTCYNEPFCFNVYGLADPDSLVSLTYNGTLPGATFTTTTQGDSTIGTFCWSPGTSTGVFNFTISAVSEVCPSILRTSHNYQIVIDSTLPNSTVCRDTTIYIGYSGSITIDSTFVFNPSLNFVCGVDSVVLSRNTYTCADVGTSDTITVTTYASGDTLYCQSIIHILDNTPPVIFCQDTVGYIGSTGIITIDTSFVVSNVSDNCGVDTVYLGLDQFTCQDQDSNFIWVYAVDINGNMDSCQALIVVRDTVKPVASCKDTTAYLDVFGIATLDSLALNDSSYKICGSLQTIYLSKDTFTCDDLGVNLVTMYVVDSNGNIDSCSANVTILDTNSVNIFARCIDTTIYLDASGSFTIDSSFVDDSSYAICGIDGVDLSQYNFTCNDIGVNQVKLYVIIAGIYVDSCIANVTVLDTLNPVAQCKNITVYLDSFGNASIDSSDVDNGSYDNCSSITFNLSQTSFTCLDTGVNIVGVRVKDSSNNKDSCVSQVTVIDTIKPTALCKDTTIYLNSGGVYTIDSSYIDNGSNKACIGIANMLPSQLNFNCSDVGANLVTLTVTCNNGLSNSCTSNVYVYDTLKPIAICRDTILYLDSLGQLSINVSVVDNGSTDNCTITSRSISRTSFNCSDTGVNVVELYVEDASGNKDTCSANITILDTLVYPINAGIDTNLCGIYQLTLYAQTPPSNLTGTWNILTGPGTPSLSNTSNPNAQLNGLVAGEYNLEWVVSNPLSCKEIRDTIKVSVYNLPVATAGPDQSLCYTSQTTMSANAVSSPYQGMWSQLSGPASVSMTSPSSHNTLVTGMSTPGNYEFEWEVYNPVCAQYERDTMEIVVNHTLISNAGSNQYLCDTNATTLIGNVASSGQWSVDNSITPPSIPVFSNVNNPNTNVSNLVEGTYSFVWTIFNGVCSPSRDTVQVYVYNQPTSNAGTDTTLCDVFNLTLYGNQPQGTAHGEWILDNSIVAPSVPVFSDSSKYNSVVSNLVEGVYRLVWVVRNGNCTAAYDTVQLDVWNRPVADAGVDSGLCGVYQLNMYAVSTPYPGTWTLLPGSPNSPVISSSSASNTSVSGLIEGVYHFEWRVTNGPCFDLRDTVTISVFDSVKAIVGPDQAFCYKSSTLVNAIPLSGTATGTWYLHSSTPNVPNFNPNTSSTTVSNLQETGRYELYWEAVNGVCPVSRDTILIETFAVPTANFELDTTKVCLDGCIGVDNLSTIHPNDSIVNYTWRYGADEVTGEIEEMCFNTIGSFDVRLIVESSNGCSDTMSRPDYVKVYERPRADFNYFLVPDPNTSTKIAVSDLSNGSVDWQYDMGDGTTYPYDEFTHEYMDSGFYDIVQVVTNQWGCKDTLTKTAFIHILLVYVPTAFTVNGDGLNDELRPYVSGDDPLAYRFQIFNRWGDLIFETDNKQKAWDGTFKGEPASVGMYNWRLQTKYKDGNVYKDFGGHFMLLR